VILPAGVPGIRVLVMDDEEMIRALAATMLDKLGYQAVVCADGAQAVAAYREAADQGRPFAAAILDMTVPGGMGGREPAREIRELDPAAVLISSTGYSIDATSARMEEDLFRGSIAKPYNLEKLTRELARLTGNAARSLSDYTGRSEKPGVCGQISGRLQVHSRSYGSKRSRNLDQTAGFAAGLWIIRQSPGGRYFIDTHRLKGNFISACLAWNGPRSSLDLWLSRRMSVRRGSCPGFIPVSAEACPANPSGPTFSFHAPERSSTDRGLR